MVRLQFGLLRKVYTFTTLNLAHYKIGLWRLLQSGVHVKGEYRGSRDFKLDCKTNACFIVLQFYKGLVRISILTKLSLRNGPVLQYARC